MRSLSDNEEGEENLPDIGSYIPVFIVGGGHLDKIIQAPEALQNIGLARVTIHLFAVLIKLIPPHLDVRYRGHWGH